MDTNSTSHGLERFVEAQDRVYAAVKEELAAGNKTSHWMWFVFPQLKALGYSEKAKFFGLVDLAEAEAYLAHPVLGPRLIACCAEMRRHEAVGAEFVLGAVDAKKFRSCLTLFSRVPGAPPIFEELLRSFYGGEPDLATERLL